MSNLRRFYNKGNIYFITMVSYKRAMIFKGNEKLLINSVVKFKNKMNFNIIAYVILPDHIHLLIDTKQNNLSELIQRIKLSFYRKYNYSRNEKVPRIWQHRFWDHIIRDEPDYANHFDYIHYNPVKHGYVKNPKEWEFSSFNHYFNKEYYTFDWGTKETVLFDGLFGE